MYWQIELNKESEAITMINTAKGLFKFNRLPYDLKVSLAIFQRNIEEITKT